MLGMLMLLSSRMLAQSPTAPALDFNVFVQNDFTAIGAETEGPIAMGGNLNLNGNHNASSQNVGTYQVNGKYVSLLVGGQVNFNGGAMQVLNNGYVKIGTGTNLSIWYVDNNNAQSPMRIVGSGQPYWQWPNIALSANQTNVAGTAGTVSASSNPMIQGNLINFSNAFSTMQASAQSISSCSNNASLRDANNNVLTTPYSIPSNGQVKIQLNSGANVLNLTGAQMNAISNFTFNNQPSASQYLIINVDAPGSFTWNAWTNGGFGGTTQCQYIMYNFYNTTNLTISGYGAVEGTVFAPFASINKTQYANVEGQVIALSYSSVGGENHYAKFLPSYSGCAVTPTHALFTVNNSTQCLSGNSFSFTNTSTGAGTLSYAWKFGDGTTSTSQSPVKTYTAAGSYQVRLITTGTAGPDTAYQTVNILAPAAQPGAFTASAATVYQGQTNVTYTIPNVSGVTYSWSYSGTGAAITGSGNSVSITFSTTATSGTLSVTGTSNSCGASTPRTISILVKPYMTWTCTTNNDWNTASNWDGGFVPYSTISVLIPNGACAPFVTNNVSVRDIKIENSTNVDVDCNKTLSINGKLTLQGTAIGCGTLSLNGSGAQTIEGKGTVSNLKLDNANGATINNGDTIHIKHTYTPTNGTLNTNNGLELLSDSTWTAVILQSNNCSYISGNVIINKYIPGGRRAFRFFGHPFSTAIGLNQLTPYFDITGQGGNANGFTTTITNNPSAFWYNTLTGNGSAVDDSTGWIPFTNTDGNGANAWMPGQGMRALVRGAKGEGLSNCCNYTPSATTIKMYGPVNQCNTDVNTQTNANMGYNFIGNPYPSNVDLSMVTRGSAINANFSVWDPNQGAAGAYVSQPFSFSYVLPAYSAFIVRSNSGSNNQITFTEASKSGATPAALFKTTTGFGNDVVQLRITSNNDNVSWDRLLIFFNNGALDMIDDLDAEKMSNPNLDFYTYAASQEKLSVDVRPLSQQVIKLGLETDQQQNFDIRVDDYDVQPGTQLYLHDKYLNVVQPLASGMHYNFNVTSDPLSQGSNRFEINVSPNATGLQNINNTNGSISLHPNPAQDQIAVNFNTAIAGNTTVRITNVLGQEVYRQNMGYTKSGNITVPVAAMESGMYLVTVQCGAATITNKFIKQ